MSDTSLVQMPVRGFARGAVVRKFGTGQNMLVVRQLETTTVVVLCEGDAGGTLRLREIATDNLDEVSADAGRRDGEFDMRWNADMRAIDVWRGKNPGNELVIPDHVDLVVWLLGRDQEAAARVRELEAEVERLKERVQLLLSGKCINHPTQAARAVLDGEPLCQGCCDIWVRAEGRYAHDALERHPTPAPPASRLPE